MPRFAALLFTLIALALSGCHVNAPPVDVRAVTAEGSLSNRFVRSDQPTPIAARLLIEARASELRARPPVNLALVVELVPGPGVQIERVVGRGGGGGRISIPIGDLSFGEQREIVVKLAAPPHRAGAAVELLDAILRFEDVRAGVTVERRIFFGAHATASEDDLRTGRDEAVERAVARAEAAAATLEAIEAARRGAVEQAQRSLKSAPMEYHFSDDTQGGDLVNALPSVAPPQAGKPAPVRDSEVVRKAHDRAMDVLQTH